MKVRITESSIEVDGVDISHSVRSVRVNLTAGELPVVDVELVGVDSEMDLADAKLVVASRSHETLLQLGWTPPEA